jgi:hypothetical protein
MADIFTHGHALLIGVGADLPITVQDATALRDVLVNPERAAYPSAQVDLLTEAESSRQHILDAFDRLINRVSSDPQAMVVVYFSGHGGRVVKPDQPTEYYLMPYGYNTGPWSTTAISAAEFTAKIEAIQAQKLVVLLDCCHAAGMPDVKAPGETFIKSPVDLVTMLEGGQGRVIVASSHEQEFSYTGTPYSVFTNCLIEALAGKAAVNKDGYARILDVLVYLFDQVPKRAAGTQHPLVKKVLDLADNFPLCYYAGGSKRVPGEEPAPDIPHVSTLTSGQRRRLQQRLSILQQEWDIRSEKARRMGTTAGFHTDVAVKFQLEHQLLEEEAALSRLSEEMDEIEHKLQ